MIFFDIKKLEDQAAGDPKKLLELFTVYLRKVETGKAKTLRDLNLNLDGDSYLLNPYPLIEDKNTGILHKVQYLKLAGRRDYALFKLLNVSSLQLSYFPDLALDNIKHNSLLNITPTEIYFKFEEQKPWQLHSSQPKVRHNRAL